MIDEKIEPKQIYQSNIRNVTVLFGSLFSNIEVPVFDDSGCITEETRVVPITYAAKETMSMWLNSVLNQLQGGKQVGVGINTSLPRFSIELTGISRSADNSVNSNVPIYNYNTALGSDYMYKSVAPVKYNFNFDLNLYCKNMEQSLYILDQILLVFAPSITLAIKESEKLNIISNMVVQLDSISKEDNYQAGLTENRLISWKFQFVVTANMVQNVNNEKVKVIKTAMMCMIEKTSAILNSEINLDLVKPGLVKEEMENGKDIRILK